MADATFMMSLIANASSFVQGMNQAQASTTQTVAAMDKVSNAAASMSASIQKNVSSISNLVIPSNAFEKIAGILSTISIIKFGENFNTEVSKIKVITGAAGQDLEKLKNYALEIGNAMGKSGGDVASAFTVMGSVRPELLKNIDALAKTTKEAIALTKAANAMGVELTDAQSATILGESLSQFGEKADQASRYVNVLAASAKAGSSLIADTSEALKNAGVEMSAANSSFEEANAVIQMLAEIGIKGGEAGTKIRGVFAALADPTKMEKLGLNFAEVNPKIVGIETAFTNLKKAGLSTADMIDLFDVRNKNAAVHLIENIGNLKGYTETIKSGTTAAYDAESEKAKTLSMVMSGIETRFKNISASLFGYVEPALASVLSGIIKFTGTGVSVIGLLATDITVLGDGFSTLSNKSVEMQAAVYAIGEALKAIEPFAEIVAVGGVLWYGFAAAPALIGGAGAAVKGFGALMTGVSNVVGMAFLRVSANATVAATTTGAVWSLANAPLWGVGIAAEYTASKMSLIGFAAKASAQMVFAAWTGYEIGTFFWNQFEDVRKAGYWVVGELQAGWINIQIGLTELSGFFEKVGNRFSAAFQNPLSYVKTLFLEFSSYIQQKFSDFIGNLATASSKVDFLPGMGDATAKLTTFSNELQISAKRMANAANETDFSKQATAKDDEINKKIEERIGLLIQEKDTIYESQQALMNAAGNVSKSDNGQVILAKQIDDVAKASANAGNAVNNYGKKVVENAGQSISFAREQLQEFKKELTLSIPYDNAYDKKLAELKDKILKDRKAGNSALTENEANKRLEENRVQAQSNYLVEQGMAIAKERLKVYENGNILQTLKDEYDRITFLTEAHREYLVAEKASIEAGKLFNEVKNQLAKSGLNEEQARVNDLMKQYGGIISETTAKNIASIEKQAKGYTELRTAYDKLQVAGVISEQNELISLSQKYGDSIAKQIFDINNLAKARQDAANAQKEVQLAGLTGVQKDIATAAIKYGGDVEAAKQVVGLQRQKAATEELVNAQKELANSGLTESQRKYLDLAEKIGASAAKEALEMRNLSDARKAGVAELQKSIEELQATGLSEQAKSYFDVIKNVAPEYREQILVLKQQTAEIQKQSAFYNDIANQVADQFALIATGQKSVSQGWKDMANDVGSMLQKVAADQMKNQIMQAFGANNPQQDAMAAIKAAQQADADRAKQFQVTIQEVDLSVKKTIEERSLDATSKMGTTIDDGVKKLTASLDAALSNLNQSMPKAIESFGKQMADAISSIKIPTQQEQMLKAQMAGFDAPSKTPSNSGQQYDFSNSQNQTIARLAQIAEQQGVSAKDLIRFAYIETGGKFNADAYNASSGAAGMFQFVKSTAKQYGIRGNEFDMEANTTAAIRLWKDNEKALRGYLDEMNGAMAYLAHQQGAEGVKDILRTAQEGGSFDLAKTRSNMLSNVAADIGKYTGVSLSQFKQLDDSAMAKTFVDYWQKKFDAIPLEKYGSAMGEATASTKEQTQAISQSKIAQTEQTQTVAQAQTVQKEASLTQAQMLDEQNKAFMESSQAAIKAAESVGVLGLESIKGSDMIASGAQLAAAKIMNIADARVNAIYNMKATGADPEVIKKIIDANSIGNESGVEGVIKGSAQDKALAAQMEGFDTSATGFFSDFSSGIKGVVSDVTSWVKTAKKTVTGWTDSLGLTGKGGFGDLFGKDKLLGEAAQWAGTVGSLLKGDIKGAVTSGLSVGANLLGTAIAGPIGGIVAGFAANALTGLAMGGGETRSGGAYRVNEKGDFNKIQGPSGGDIGGKDGFNKVSDAMTGTVKQINDLLEKLGSKAKVTDFTGALETSDKGRGGVWAGGKLSTGQAFGEQFNGQNVFESQTSRTLNKDDAMKAYILDLKQSTLQAIQSATDVPKVVSDLLKNIDIEALDEKKVENLLLTVNGIQEAKKAFDKIMLDSNAGFDAALFDAAGGIENFQKQVAAFSEKFIPQQNKQLSDANQYTSEITKAFTDFGLSLPHSKEELVDLVRGLDLTTESGKSAFATITRLTPALDSLFSTRENANNKFLETFADSIVNTANSTAKLTTQLNSLGLPLPKTEQEFQDLAITLFDGSEEAKNQAAMLMDLYPQWKANQEAMLKTGLSLNGFTDKLRSLGNQIDAQSVKASLSNATKIGDYNQMSEDLKKPVAERQYVHSADEAGSKFSSGVMQSIRDQMNDTMMSTISDMVTTGIIQPMINAAIQSATMDTSASAMSATNDVTASAMAGSTLTMAGAGAGAGLTTGGQTAGEAMQIGGANAGKALEDGGRNTGIKVDEVIKNARKVADTMVQVMNDPEFKADMDKLSESLKPVGVAAYQGSQAINQGFSSFIQVSSQVKEESKETAKEIEKIDFKKFKESLKDFSTGLEGDDLKMSKIANAFKDVDLSSLNLSGSLENMASQIANLPDDKLKELAASAHLSVDDMQSYVLDFFNISRQRAKEALDAYKALQTGIKPQDKITEISNKYGVNHLESTFKDSKSYFEMLGKLSQDDLKTIAAANHVTVSALVQDALDYGNALKENEQKFKDFTKSLNDFSVIDKTQQTLSDLSAKYGQQINMTSAEYLKFVKGLRPEDIRAIASTYGVSIDELQSDLLNGANALKENEQKFKDFTKSLNELGNFEPDQNKKTLSDLSAKYGQQINMTSAEYLKFVKNLKPEDIQAIAQTYGISVDEVQKDLLDAGGALKGLAETVRTKAIEDFKAAIGAIDNSISSVKEGIESLNGLSAEQILEKTKQDWEKIVSSGQHLDQLTDATDKYKTAIDNVRQKQLQWIDDIKKAVDDSQSFKKTLESDILNLRKTLGQSGASYLDQISLIQKQLSGTGSNNLKDLEKQTELQGHLKELILGNLDDQINAQQKVFDKQKEQFEKQLDTAKALIDYAKDLKGFVDGLMLGDTSILTNEQRVNESQRQYQKLLGKAQSGDQEAIKGLSNAASTYLKEARNYFASSDTYTGIFKDVTSTVSGLAGSLKNQGNAGVASNQSSLDGLKEPTATPEIKSLQENALAQLMALETARQQTETDLKALLTQPPPQAIEQTQFDSVIATVNDAAMQQLQGMQSSLESLGNQTVDAFGVNIAKLSADMGMNTTQTVAAIQGMQADFGGRLSAIVGVVQQAQADAAAAQARIAQMQAAQASINAGSVTTTGGFDLNSVMPSYDVGTPYVAGDQVAQIHDGEMVIDPQSANVLRKYGISIPQIPTQNTATVDNKELIELVKQNNNLLMRLIELISNLENNSNDQVTYLAILNELLPREISRSFDKIKPRASAK